MSEDTRTIVAKVRKPHGIKGGLKVQIYDLDLGDFEKLPKLFVNQKSQWMTVQIEGIEGTESSPILYLKNFKTRNQAEELRECFLYADNASLPDLDEDEFFIEDLIGNDVYNKNMKRIGSISDIISNSAHDIFVIKSNTSQELLVPFVNEWVLEVNIDKNYIVINEAEKF